MPLNYEPYPTGESWLRMGNQAMLLQHGLQRNQAFEEDRAAQEAAAGYTANMMRDPSFRPDPNAQGYNPRGDVAAQAAYMAQQAAIQNLDDTRRRAKFDQWDQDWKSARRSSSDALAYLTAAEKQYGSDSITLKDIQDRDPQLAKTIVDKGLEAHHGVFDGQASKKNEDGTISMISHMTGEERKVDISSMPLKSLKEFLLVQSSGLEDRQKYFSAQMTNDRVMKLKNAEAWANPDAVYDPNQRKVAYRIMQVDPNTDDVRYHYFATPNPEPNELEISPTEAKAYTEILGPARKTNIEQAIAGRGPAMEEAKTGMTAYQRESVRQKNVELGLRSQKGSDLTTKDTADLELKVRKQYRESNTKKDRLGNEVYTGTPEGEQAEVDKYMAMYAGGGQAKGLSTNAQEAPQSGLSGPSGQGVRGKIEKPNAGRSFVDKKTGRKYTAYPNGTVGLPNGKKVTREEFMKIIEGQ